MNRVASDQRGYALVTVLLAALVLGASVLAALAVADTSTLRSGTDVREKQALDAARAGVALFGSRLARDPDYWRTCSRPAAERVRSAPLWSGTETPLWSRVAPADSEDGADYRAEFSIEIIPQPPKTACVGTDPTSVFDANANVIRTRVTGRSGSVRRTLVANFRRGSFLEYVYFTDRETLDPALFTTSASRIAACSRKRVEASPLVGRDASNQDCQEIQFAAVDAVAGVAHTNDSSFLVCGSPAIERGEATGVAPVKKACGGGDPPGFVGRQPDIPLPVSPGGTLLEVATNSQEGAYLLEGRTSLEFGEDAAGPSVTVTGASGTRTLRMPQSGVIYVRNRSSCSGLSAPNAVDYSGENPDCAITRVQGEVAKSVTVVSDNDILIDGPLTRSSSTDVLTGLVASNFVRVRHRGREECSRYRTDRQCRDLTDKGTAEARRELVCPPGNQQLGNVRVDAAILALKHSFLVDNWNDCSGGRLTVRGAIVQAFRGPVGTGNGTTTSTGFVKDYAYDELLQTKGPPYFPPPPSADWRPVRVTEQLPAASPGG